LFGLIDFNLDDLSTAISENDQTTIGELVIKANDAFVELFRNRWSQANLKVYIRVNENVVHVFVQTANGRLIPISDRSAGLRQFIALLAFVESNRQEGQRVILLIDEAETHLHYNAQADLINIFTRQTFVEKIIYTTHSAGCLPLDLGTGVRVIEPVGPEDKPREEWERSKINNAFWNVGPGFSPLLMAMGASSFVFAALRKAVIGEGVTEAILLPTILREATRKPLDFQVAPGVSNVHADAVRELDASAARLAYIVDGDPGGLDNRQKLIDNGVEAERIVVLGPDEALAIEDVVNAEIYLEAVNRVLGFYEKPLCPADRIEAAGRKGAVKAWCEENGVEAPSERVVAQHILQVAADRRREADPEKPDQVLDEARRDLVVEAHAKLKALMA
jgi:predicted ATP-dependent endonuclease of OLD family